MLTLLVTFPVNAQLNVDCTPIAETGYDAGTPFSLTVITINGKKVEEDLARAYFAMYNAAQAEGVNLVLSSGFRTHAQQTYLYDCYQDWVSAGSPTNASGGKLCVNGCGSCNIAATPGYSKHQKGDAVDISTNGGTNAAYSWLKGWGYTGSGHAFGFADTFNPPEPWHWVYVNPGTWVGPCDGPGASEPACTPSPVAGAESSVFKDLPPGAFGQKEAELCYAAGITNGCAVDYFCPNCSTTRAMAVTLLIRAAGIPVDANASPSFTDLTPGAYYVPYVEKAKELGITQGCSATEFCPNDAVTRKEFAKFLIETLGVPTVSPASPSFTDVSQGDWGYPYVETLKALCITTGCSATTYCPDEPVTRAMAAIFISRAWDLADTNDCISYCDSDACAGASFCENWSECTFASTCAEIGTRARTCHAFSCVGAVTDATCAETTSDESDSCSRDTDGTVVDGWGPWSDCAPTAQCATTGTRSRTRVICSDGSEAEDTQTQSCTPADDPDCAPGPDAAPDAGAAPGPEPTPDGVVSDSSDGGASVPDATDGSDSAADTAQPGDSGSGPVDGGSGAGTDGAPASPDDDAPGVADTTVPGAPGGGTSSGCSGAPLQAPAPWLGMVLCLWVAARVRRRHT